MLFFLSKNGGPEGFAPIPSSGELSCFVKGSCTGGTPREWVFLFSLHFYCALRWLGCKSCHQPKKKSNPTAGGRPQTQLGTRYGWPLAHKEFLRPLTGFVLTGFFSRWVSISMHPPHQKTWWGRRFNRRQPDRETGLHGTCSKSQKEE